MPRIVVFELRWIENIKLDVQSKFPRRFAELLANLFVFVKPFLQMKLNLIFACSKPVFMALKTHSYAFDIVVNKAKVVMLMQIDAIGDHLEQNFAICMLLKYNVFRT